MLPVIGWLMLWLLLVVLSLLLLAALLLNPVLPALILRTSCAVAGEKKPGWLMALGLGYSVTLTYSLLSFFFLYLVGKYDPHTGAYFGPWHVLGVVLALLIGCGLAALLYYLTIAPEGGKALAVSGLQLLLKYLAVFVQLMLLAGTLFTARALGHSWAWGDRVLAVIPNAILVTFLVVLLYLLAAAAVLNLFLPSMILRASCSVADVKEPGYLISFPVGYLTILIYGLLAWPFVVVLGKMDVDPEAPFGSMHLCGYLLALAVGWALAALLYRLVIASSFLKGFWVASLQLLLHGLASALTWGLLLTILSLWQLLQFPLPGVTAPHPAARAAPAAIVFVDPS